MAQPRAADAIKTLAEASGGCIRPVQLRRTDLDTGQVEQVIVPCGATLATLCPACADRAKSLRAAQCREGWHLENEPIPPPAPPDDWQAWLLEQRAELQQLRDRMHAAGDETAGLDELIGEVDAELARSGIRGNPDPGASKKAAAPVHPAPPGRPGPAPPHDQPAHHRQGLHRPRRQDVPPVDVPHPDLRQLRQGAGGRHPRRPGQLRLPAGRPGRDPLRRAGRPVHPEPAPLPRLRGAVLRRRRTAKTPRPARAPGDPRHRVPRRPAPGPRRHLPPGLVALHRRDPVRRRPAPGLARAIRELPRPGHRGSPAHLGPGPRRHRPARSRRCTWPGSGPSSTPRACWPGRRTPAGASGT